MADLENRTRTALRQFDSNMKGIFDRASFYDQDVYSQASYAELSGSNRCFKYTLFAANLIFFIFGCVLCAVGSYAQTNKLAQLAGTTIAAGVIALGVFILLLALVGAVAAYKELRFLLLLYFLFLLLFSLILFFVGIAVYVEKDDAGTLITDAWKIANPDVKIGLEQLFNCCGFIDKNDEASLSPKLNCSGNAELTSLWQRPCYDEFVSKFKSYYITAGGCAIGFAVIMFVGALLVCLLMRGIKQKATERDLAKLRAQTNTEEAPPIPISAVAAGGPDDEEEDDVDEEQYAR